MIKILVQNYWYVAKAHSSSTHQFPERKHPQSTTSIYEFYLPTLHQKLPTACLYSSLLSTQVVVFSFIVSYTSQVPVEFFGSKRCKYCRYNEFNSVVIVHMSYEITPSDYHLAHHRHSPLILWLFQLTAVFLHSQLILILLLSDIILPGGFRGDRVQYVSLLWRRNRVVSNRRGWSASAVGLVLAVATRRRADLPHRLQSAD